jgi:hypothetical protein
MTVKTEKSLRGIVEKCLVDGEVAYISQTDLNSHVILDERMLIGEELERLLDTFGSDVTIVERNGELKLLIGI